MDRMSSSGKHDPPLTEVVGPASNGFGAVLVVSQAVDIFRFQDDVLAVSIIFNVMLFVIDRKVLNSLGNRMLVLGGPDAKRAEWRMADVGSSHHLAIILRTQGDVAAIVKGIETVSRLHEVSDGCALLLFHPHLGFRRSKLVAVLQVLLIARICVGSKVPSRPDHAIPETKKELIVLQQLRR